MENQALYIQFNCATFPLFVQGFSHIPNMHLPTPLPCLPQTYGIQTFLLPPHLRHQKSQPLLLLQSKVNNGSHISILRDRILATVNAIIHLLWDHFSYSLIQRRIIPYPITLLPRLFPHYPPRHPVVETPQQYSDERVTTHCFAPKSRTDCTMARQKWTNIQEYATSHPKMRSSQYQIFHFFWRLLMTSGQSSPVTVISHPRYLKYVTISSGCPHALKDVAAPARASCSVSRRLLWSMVRVHRSVVGWRRLSDSQGTNMLQGGKWDWVWFPYSIITFVYHTWR